MVGVGEEEAWHPGEILWEASFTGGCVLLLQHYACAVMFERCAVPSSLLVCRLWENLNRLGRGPRWQARLVRDSGVPPRRREAGAGI